ncbi:MAG: THUMP domain-containing protein [Candidatus Bathyarchaeota archaeon]|nr:THUMP domain-containing protein [Candidatus Bathyarchaeota archaeon]MDH5787374.1 THUMP domain-containing protein [Candidatus Bathyarchaeota archaeon]
MLRDFNLLATTSRGNGGDACSELCFLLGQIGDSAPTVEKTGIAGLIAAKTALNPFEVINRFREILRERPYEFRYMFRVIPIEKVVRTDLSQIEHAVTEFGSKIAENETFRVTVEKRFTATPTQDIIETAAANIERKVDLNKPDKIILLEVVGGLTGISVIEPNAILSIMKEKVL